jgi:hypothetical protein
MAVFWVVAIALMMEAASTSETLVNFYQTTRRYNPEDSHFHYITCHVPSVEDLVHSQQEVDISVELVTF